ncbi:hypothetical protein D3C73_1652300 [compost metagenome]
MEPYRTSITDGDRQVIAEILDNEKVIVGRMHAIKKEAGDWLQNLGTVRVQHNAYQQSFSIDSLFIDWRK